MAKLVVFKFEAADGASQALELVKPLQSQYMLELFDAVVVSWPKGAIKIKNATISTGGGEINSGWSFLGEMLFGLIFCAPFLGLAAGTAMGAISEKISDYGINDKFKKNGAGENNRRYFSYLPADRKLHYR